MAAGDLVTDVYMYEYNGLVIGDNTDIHVTEIKGLLGYPSMRSGTVNRFGNHGGVPGRHYLPPREFIIKIDYVPDTDIEFGDKRLELMKAFAPRVNPTDEQPFVFQHPGDTGKVRINCRPIDFDAAVDRQFALSWPHQAVRFEASDPRHYSNQLFSTVVTLTADTTGLTFPLDFPLNFGPATANTVTMLNEGTSPSSWVATIAGQIDGPRIEKVGTGEEINLPNLNVPAGQTLVIDEAARTILLEGANGRQYLTKASRWFKLDPLGNTTVRFSSNGSSSGATLTMSWRYTYWGES